MIKSLKCKFWLTYYLRHGYFKTTDDNKKIHRKKEDIWCLQVTDKALEVIKDFIKKKPWFRCTDYNGLSADPGPALGHGFWMSREMNDEVFDEREQVCQ